MEMAELRTRFGEKILAFQSMLHRCPERGLEETQTTALIRERMRLPGVEELPLALPTGAAFRLKTGGTGKALVLRADIDGLCVEESNEHALRSANTGMMHACGHDTHMAALFGAALLLSGQRASLSGDVVFLFQPAEEIMRGAIAVAEAGLFECMDTGAVFGLHNMPSMPIGTVGVREGPLMAAKDSFRITIGGRGGHGAAPESCIDPIVAASAVVTALQTVVSRTVSPLDTAVVSVCSIHGGQTDNRIEDTVTLSGSIRTFQAETRALVLNRMEQIVTSCAAALGCTGTLCITDSAPALVNHAALADAAATAAHAVGTLVRPDMAMISEDFAFYGAYAPTFFFFLGSGNEQPGAPLHSADYLAHPDTALYGAALLANVAKAYFMTMTAGEKSNR